MNVLQYITKHKMFFLVFCYALIATFLLYLTEHIYKPVYVFQMVQKIFLFVLLPVFAFWYWKKNILHIGKIGKQAILYGGILGMVGAGIIVGAYLLLQGFIDWQAIQASLESRSITSSTFVIIFVYIMFGNSFVEELFFRGFLFHELKKTSRIFAYIFTSLLFSLYHIAIFGNWFSDFLLLLALVGLFVGALFFSWLYEKTNGIWGAWIFHILADIVIVFIGYSVLFV